MSLSPLDRGINNNPASEPLLAADGEVIPEATSVPLGELYEVEFGEGALGIDIQGADVGQVFIIRDRKHQSRRKTFAARKGGNVIVGDRVVRVAGVLVTGMNTEQVRDVIVSCPRPLTLTFERVPESLRPAIHATPVGEHVLYDRPIDGTNVILLEPQGAPAGAIPGGYYIRRRYCGPFSWLVGCFFTPLIVFCPLDSVTVYVEPGTGRRIIVDEF